MCDLVCSRIDKNLENVLVDGLISNANVVS